MTPDQVMARYASCTAAEAAWVLCYLAALEPGKVAAAFAAYDRHSAEPVPAVTP